MYDLSGNIRIYIFHHINPKSLFVNCPEHRGVTYAPPSPS